MCVYEKKQQYLIITMMDCYIKIAETKDWKGPKQKQNYYLLKRNEHRNREKQHTSIKRTTEVWPRFRAISNGVKLSSFTAKGSAAQQPSPFPNKLDWYYKPQKTSKDCSSLD